MQLVILEQAGMAPSFMLRSLQVPAVVTISTISIILQILCWWLYLPCLNSSSKFTRVVAVISNQWDEDVGSQEFSVEKTVSSGVRWPGMESCLCQFVAM